MTTDISQTERSELPLTVWQKRQAAMLYRWMSLDYLHGLKNLINTLIKGTDVTLELAKQQERDALIATPKWGVRDTSANWSTFAYPALEEFRKSTLWHISARVNEEYGKTGAYQCAHMLSEHSSMWMTQEEEERFNAQFSTVASYAYKIDEAAAHRLDDFGMVLSWAEEEAPLFPKLPRMRVRADVVGESGKRPIRTGVYVPQDDPNGTLQFGWTGNSDGMLDSVKTFNALGIKAIRSIGREALWLEERSMVEYTREALRKGEIQSAFGYRPDDINSVLRARILLADQIFTERPCKWYFVEMIDGEFDDETAVEADALKEARFSAEPGHPCPKTGEWFAVNLGGKAVSMKQGEPMPGPKFGPMGKVIWYFRSPSG